MNKIFDTKNGKKAGMKSRERVIAALNHKPTDRVPVDLGGTPCSGAHVSIIAKLRQGLGLDKAGEPVKVIDLHQMLGEVGADLQEALGLDVVAMPRKMSSFGFENVNWKSWKTFDGTVVLVPDKFNTEAESDGSILQYPEGDRSAAASAKMPKGGFYFDAIIRQEPIDESRLDPTDNLEEFTVLGEEELKFWQEESSRLYNETSLAITAAMPGMAFGDIARVVAVSMKHPKGIRDIEEWYISTVTRKSYIKEVFAGQAEIAVKNLELIYQAVGDKIQIVCLDGADLAAQNTLFCSLEGYRELYLPYAKKLNDWIHSKTEWKTFKHCCGACEPLIEGFIEAGYDILNPVQCSAKGMEPELLVDKYGDRIVFWGGGVDTQKTLPFGSEDEVYEQVIERARIFNKKNGFIFNTIHNIQCNTPIGNVLAMYKALGRKV